MMAELRTAFNTDKTRSKAWRLAQLCAMEKMLDESRDELCDAVYADLKKDKFQAYMQEIALIYQEIYDAKKHLDAWMSDEYVVNGLMTAPAQSLIQKDPLGVVLILGAWNYNVLLSIQPMVGAIAAGNCVVVKPGSYSANSSSVICKVINKYMDPDCILAVEGNRNVTNALLEQKFDKIFFTGSPFVGKVVAEAAAKHLTPVVLELGGKSPCIVDRTADLYVSARRYCWGAFMNSGQTCVRPDYVMVHEAVADDFIREVKAALGEFYGGDVKRSEFFGRLVNDSAFERLKKCLDKDAKYLVHGGAHDKAERYLEPSLFDFGRDLQAFAASELMQDELFGPLVPIFRYRDLDAEVLPFIRAHEKPLALYVFTADGEVAERTLRLTTSGGAIVNDVVVHLANPELPFGGVGASGMGAYHGKHSFDCFSHRKGVVKRITFGDAPLRYPPYTSVNQAIMNFFLTPAINYYIGEATHLLTDKKNVAIGVMGMYIVRNALKAKL